MCKPKVTEDEILSHDNVPVELAADYLGKTANFLRCAMQSQRCPFGIGVKMEGGKWSYSISPGMLIAYKTGDMIIHIRNSGELMKGVVQNAT